MGSEYATILQVNVRNVIKMLEKDGWFEAVLKPVQAQAESIEEQIPS